MKAIAATLVFTVGMGTGAYLAYRQISPVVEEQKRQITTLQHHQTKAIANAYVVRENGLRPYTLQTVADAEESYAIAYARDIGGYEWQFQIPISDYMKFRVQQHRMPAMKHIGDSLMQYVTPEDPTIKRIAGEFLKYAKTREEAAQNIVDFAQQTVYNKDIESKGTEFVRYPLETLVENSGDCEDTAILAASLLKAARFDVALIEFPDHMAVGIVGDFTGSYYEVDGKKYHYAETAGAEWPGKRSRTWKIGEMPTERDATVYKVE
jgi:hypothetical protein